MFFLVNIPAWSNTYCRDVFNRLVNSVSNVYGTKPTLTIVESDFLVAETYNTGEVKVGSRLIHLCRSFGKDSTNALAHVLSHELAHYYQNHAWISNFTSAYANIEWSRKLTESEQQLLPVYETQADEMGFFYALNAGFQTWKVSEAVLDSIYIWYQLPAELPGYPPLEQRKKIALESKSKVQSLIPLFRISNYFTLIAKHASVESQYVFYQSSGYCLDHLVHENIKTPNVLNNLGVLYFLAAQAYFYEPVNRLMYPLVMDDNASAMDMSEGVRGVTPSNQELPDEAVELLEKSREAFASALKGNKNYLPSNINMAFVHFILKEQGALADKIQYLQPLVNEQQIFLPVLYQIDALRYYLKGDAKKMTESFKKAIKLNDKTAERNHLLLSKTKTNLDETMELVKWPSDTTEKLYGKKVIDYFNGFRSKKENRVDPYHQKFILWSDKNEDGIIYTFRNQILNTIYKDLLFFEITSLQFSTSKGLQLGMKAEEVEKKYGNQYTKSISSGSVQLLYPSQQMIVTIDHATGNVAGITYYGIKN